LRPNETDPILEAAWYVRQQYWRRKLGRLRLDAEPLEEQLARYHRVTWGLTVVPLVLALLFVILFTAFQRPDVGIALATILLLPVVVLAWIDYGLLKRRVARYRHELEEYRKRQGTPGRT
jgi:membrane protein YdbS with pleckstrin-like domain